MPLWWIRYWSKSNPSNAKNCKVMKRTNEIHLMELLCSMKSFHLSNSNPSNAENWKGYAKNKWKSFDGTISFKEQTSPVEETCVDLPFWWIHGLVDQMRKIGKVYKEQWKSFDGTHWKQWNSTISLNNKRVQSKKPALICLSDRSMYLSMAIHQMRKIGKVM